MFAGIVIDANAVQPLKAKLGMLATLLPIFTVVQVVLSEKAEPIASVSKVSVWMLLQPSKAE